MFTTALGTPVHPANVRRAFARLRRAAGIDGEWTPYHLRHAAVSLLSDAGVPPEVIADLLGHVDTRMVFRVYRHAITPIVAGGADHMTALFGRAASDTST